MPYGRYKKTTTNALGKYTARTKRKRTANATKVKFQRPTARNQRKQIMSNALAIKHLRRVCLPKQVYCDWQLTSAIFATLDAGNFTRTWGCVPLTNFPGWSQCLRQDDNVGESSTTFVRNLSLNLRYILGNSSYANFNVWIVTPRKDANDRDWPAQINSGVDPVSPTEFTESPNAFNMRLNSALFKVHFASYRTLTETTLFQAVNPNFPAGNPNTTWAKGSVNIKCNINVRQPIRSGSWRQLLYNALPYYQRYYMLVCIVQNAPADVQLNTGAQFTFDQLATTINSS